MNAFPWVLSAIINGMVSKRRYDAFFAIRCDDNQQQQMASGGGEAGESVAGEVLLQLEGCSFAWNEERCAVRDIAFDGRKVSRINTHLRQSDNVQEKSDEGKS